MRPCRIKMGSVIPAGMMAMLVVNMLCLDAHAVCADPPPPPTCDVDGQFIGGRWDLSQIAGNYSFSGSETFWPFIDDGSVTDIYQTSGSLNVAMLGGAEDNYIDVACDGSVTGRGRERISGSLTKSPNIWYYNPDFCSGFPATMTWSIDIERSYSISGSVSGTGQLDLSYQVDTATLDFSGLMAQSFDCVFIAAQRSFALDIAGDTEQVRLSGGYDPEAGTFSPTISHPSGPSWLDAALHGVALNQTHDYDESTIQLAPSFLGTGTAQSMPQTYNKFFIQNGVSVAASLQAAAEPKQPRIEAMQLQSPAQYLRDVSVDTEVRVEIDWLGQPPGTVEFSYGTQSATVAGGNVVTWAFDAGDEADTITAVARQGGEESLPYTINAAKVMVPEWAGVAADWSGQSGVRYDAVLDWPVSMETTRTLDTISLFSGLWGISGGASSSLEALAWSNGSPGSGTLQTQLDFRAAGKRSSLSLHGGNETTLSCDALHIEGQATAQFPSLRWQRTLNPLTAVPGLQTGACAISGLLCQTIQSIGIKASAEVSLSGTADYEGTTGPMQWVGGSLSGDIGGRISANAGLPPPLASVASVSVWGGADGCIEMQVSPAVQLSQLGGALEVGASASFLGMSTEATKDWPFGDECGGARYVSKGFPSGAWVPHDGQLAMAVTEVGGQTRGIAVWSEASSQGPRPLGEIHYRLYQAGTWSAIQTLTDDGKANFAPVVAFDPAGNVMVVYQRSIQLPASAPAGLPEFANSVELHWAHLDGNDGAVVAEGTLTDSIGLDFGAQLRVDEDGGLWLFWQRALGVDITGTAQTPAQIWEANWQGNGWSSAELVADDLIGVWGWSAAVRNADTQWVVLSVDEDLDFSTEVDRDLSIVRKDTGQWTPQAPLTDDGLRDDSPHIVWDPVEGPLLLWRSGDEVVELRGDFSGIPQPAFSSPDPLLDEGVDAEFAHASVMSGSLGPRVYWNQAGRIIQTGRQVASVPWEVPTLVLDSELAQRVLASKAVSGQPVFAYATQVIGPGRFRSPFLTPAFSESVGLAVFRDGFE